jgi:hypothetical protein
MAKCGFEDINLKPDHLLITFNPDGQLVIDSFGKPEVRLCNLELVKPISLSSQTNPLNERLF